MPPFIVQPQLYFLSHLTLRNKHASTTLTEVIHPSRTFKRVVLFLRLIHAMQFSFRYVNLTANRDTFLARQPQRVLLTMLEVA